MALKYGWYSSIGRARKSMRLEKAANSNFRHPHAKDVVFGSNPNASHIFKICVVKGNSVNAGVYVLGSNPGILVGIYSNMKVYKTILNSY